MEIAVHVRLFVEKSPINCSGRFQQWTAWFSDQPLTSAKADDPNLAIKSLIALTGRTELDVSGMSLDPDSTRCEHYEFLVSLCDPLDPVTDSTIPSSKE